MLPTLEKARAPVPHERLLRSWIEQVFDCRLPGVVWECSASQMLCLIAKDESALGREVYSVISTTQGIGIYLGKLARLFPGSFERLQREKDNYWRIKPIKDYAHAHGQTKQTPSAPS
jgi:hypothetical protein